MTPLPATKAPTTERAGFAVHGLTGLLLVLVFLGGGIGVAALGFALGLVAVGVFGFIVAVFGLISLNGFFILEPNQAMVLVLFGRYRHTVREAGWHWVNPLTRKEKMSLRVRNFNTPTLKVNDADGNPIEIGTVVVWRVVDTARATFDVQDYAQFVHVQSETALRHLASKYHYDQGAQPGGPSLRGSVDEVSRDLQGEIQTRLQLAGLQVVEARLSHLAYAPEIAGAMLQRQQAAAILAARQRIAAGAVGIVDTVLQTLRGKKIVELTPQQRADLVSRLLIVLTSDRGAQPVLPTG